MMRSKAYIFYLALIAISHTSSAFSETSKQVWKCGKIYTDNPKKNEKCIAVEGSMVCGSEGNKYYSPRRMSGTASGPCVPSHSKTSPIVNLEKLKQNKDEHEKLVAESHATQEKYDAKIAERPKSSENSNKDATPELTKGMGTEDLNALSNILNGDKPK